MRKTQAEYIEQVVSNFFTKEITPCDTSPGENLGFLKRFSVFFNISRLEVISSFALSTLI